jgi:predicted TIM-barrel fold metal-dependent hydrolase
MQVNDMIMVSIDDHIVEPPDVFEKHMPAKYLDQAPKVVQKDDGSHRWLFQGREIGTLALGATATWPIEERNSDPSSYAEMRPSAYDIDARIEDMSAGGVLTGMPFPTFCGFSGNHLAQGADEDLTAMAFSAYNDWMIDDWCMKYPGRFMPLAIAPVRNPDNMVKEIHRVAKKGVTAISLPEVPDATGLPSIYSGAWDPVFKALVDTDTVMCFHIGGGYKALMRPPEAPDYLHVLLAPMMSIVCMTDLFAAGVFRRFPDLKVAVSEGGIGWVPFFLDRMDRIIVTQSWTGFEADSRGRTPTEVWRDQFLGCFISDPAGLALRDRIGIDNISWEADYPHADTPWPTGPEDLLMECTNAGMTDAEIDKVSHQNALRFMRYDPFQHIPEDQATVGALRALAPDVDTSETSKEEYRRRWELAQSSA